MAGSALAHNEDIGAVLSLGKRGGGVEKIGGLGLQLEEGIVREEGLPDEVV